MIYKHALGSYRGTDSLRQDVLKQVCLFGTKQVLSSITNGLLQQFLLPSNGSHDPVREH
jgi:hypothetical protein